MMKREGEPWMPAPEYGKPLTGMSINLVVRDIEKATDFQQAVLLATVVYSDPDFAVIEGYGTQWMLHADHTYSDHVLSGSLGPDEARGLGIEIRLHNCDPDEAEQRARGLGYTVVAGSADKPHGLREVYILDDDGYLWVPDTPLT